MDQIVGYLPLILIVAVFWLLIVRPARNRQKAMVQVQSSVQPGTEVMLNSGIFGTVRSVEDEVVSLEVAPGSTLRVHRQAIGRVVEPTAVSTEDDGPFGASATDHD